MKKLIFFLLLSMVLVEGCKHKPSRGRAQMVPEISVAKPIIQDITVTKDYPGYISSIQTVDLVARVNGTLEKLLFKAGQVVKKGQLLFVIEPTVYQNAVKQAEAARSTAKAQLSYACNEYDRMLQAQKSDAVSEMQVLQSKSQMEQARSSLANAEAALNTARTNLEYCFVRAPFTGTISENTQDVGSYISGAVQPQVIATIYKDNKVYAYFNISDNQMIDMEMDHPTSSSDAKNLIISVGQDKKIKFPAKLDYLAPNVEISTGTILLRAIVDNPKRVLKNGMYANITLPYQQVSNAILVDPASIGMDQQGAFLYVVNDSNVVEYRSIEVGEVLGDTLQQVVKNLKSNESYVTKALMKVKEGMKIAPVTKDVKH